MPGMTISVKRISTSPSEFENLRGLFCACSLVDPVSEFFQGFAAHLPDAVLAFDYEHDFVTRRRRRNWITALGGRLSISPRVLSYLGPVRSRSVRVRSTAWRKGEPAATFASDLSNWAFPQAAPLSAPTAQRDMATPWPPPLIARCLALGVSQTRPELFKVGLCQAAST